MSIHLSVEHFAAEGKSSFPPLLFIHGGYVDSRCWHPHFIPFFRQHHVDCYTLDLAGHGKSGGRDELHTFGLEEYVADIGQAVGQIPAKPILVGHSMGALLVQIYAKHAPEDLAAIAMLSPVPPTGTSGSGFFISLGNPGFVGALARVKDGEATEEDLETLARIYFAPGTRPSTVAKYVVDMQAESSRAVMEMAMLPFRVHFGFPDIPAFVMGGEDDRVFPSWTLHWTALPWRTRPVVIPGAGHMLMLDPPWHDAAMALLRWVKGIS